MDIIKEQIRLQLISDGFEGLKNAKWDGNIIFDNTDLIEIEIDYIKDISIQTPIAIKNILDSNKETFEVLDTTGIKYKGDVKNDYFNFTSATFGTVNYDYSLIFTKYNNIPKEEENDNESV